MTRPLILAATTAALLLGVVGCDAGGPDPFEREVLVESYQQAGAKLNPVRLSRTVPLDSTYDASDLAVRGADVRVDLLAEDGSVEARYPYAPDPDSVGLYIPDPADADTPRVRPLRRYRLVADVPDGPTLRATTTVPDTFRLVRVNEDTARYQSDEQIALTVTPTQYPGRDQSFYIFSTEALEPTEENLTPLVREFFEDDDDLTLEDLRITSSPILNEASYDKNEDGTITIRLPWIAVAFYGPNRTRANAIDDNIYDFQRSQASQGGGGGFSPGSIPNIIEHVENGTGVFGSYASTDTVVVIQQSTGGGLFDQDAKPPPEFGATFQ
jgi:hypothetical protein